MIAFCRSDTIIEENREEVKVYDIGGKLSLRTQRGMSQDDLAEKLEVSRQSVSKWETAQSTPDLDKIIRLADLFGVSVDEPAGAGG